MAGGKAGTRTGREARSRAEAREGATPCRAFRAAQAHWGGRRARAAAVGGGAPGRSLRGPTRPGEGRARAQAQARHRRGGWGGFFRKVREASGKGAARRAGPRLYKGGAGAERQLLLRPGAVSL